MQVRPGARYVSVLGNAVPFTEVLTNPPFATAAVSVFVAVRREGSRRVRHCPPLDHDGGEFNRTHDLESVVVKRTFQPNNLKRARRHGFRARKATAGGRAVLKSRRAKGRHRLSA